MIWVKSFLRRPEGVWICRYSNPQINRKVGNLGKISSFKHPGNMFLSFLGTCYYVYTYIWPSVWWSPPPPQDADGPYKLCVYIYIYVSSIYIYICACVYVCSMYMCKCLQYVYVYVHVYVCLYVYVSLPLVDVNPPYHTEGGGREHETRDHI